MTVKISVSLPDDVYERIADQDNVSAYIAEAVRQRLGRDEVRAAMRAVGYPEIPYDPEGAARRMQEIKDAITPELKEQAYAKVAEGSPWTVDEVRRYFENRKKR